MMHTAVALLLARKIAALLKMHLCAASSLARFKHNNVRLSLNRRRILPFFTEAHQLRKNNYCRLRIAYSQLHRT
ncbi:hypothetical protein D3C86_2105940 [compost metagenome]